MSDAASFAKFVPGFDFLQNLSKGTGGSNNPIPGVSSWVAPTLDPEELEKRITDLKAVLFWLEQNTTALKATIQALEVQKMTLATLKSMNMDMSAMAKAFQFPDFSAGTQAKKEPAPAGTSDATAPKAHQAEPVQPNQEATEKPTEKPTEKAKAKAGAALPNLDPLQLWGSLTQQFQQIATQALQDVTKAQASGAMAKAAQPQAAAAKTSAGTSKTKGAPKKVAKKPVAKRTASRKSI
jgi:hypothetical protein